MVFLVGHLVSIGEGHGLRWWLLLRKLSRTLFSVQKVSGDVFKQFGMLHRGHVSPNKHRPVENWMSGRSSSSSSSSAFRSCPPALSAFPRLYFLPGVGDGPLVFTSNLLSSITARACFTSVAASVGSGDSEFFALEVLGEYRSDSLQSLRNTNGAKVVSPNSQHVPTNGGPEYHRHRPQDDAASSTEYKLHTVSP